MSKYLVYMKNDFCLTGKEYFGDSEGKIIGYHNPRLATLFSTKKEALRFCTTFDMDGVKIDLKERHFKSFDDCKYVFREIPKVNYTHSKKYTVETPKEVLEWWMQYKNLPERSVKYDDYKTWPKLYSLFTYLFDLATYNSRDYKEKYETCQIKVPKSGNIKDFRAELNLVLDFCTFFNEGYKVFPIFDHELSQYESRYFLYKSDDDCQITNGSYTKFEGTFEEVFNKIRNEYYYS
jgi:hypothetical protein